MQFHEVAERFAISVVDADEVKLFNRVMKSSVNDPLLLISTEMMIFQMLISQVEESGCYQGLSTLSLCSFPAFSI